MEILVLVQDYPNENNKYAMNYVHTRNLEYLKNSLNISVLSFNTKESYIYEGISVYSLQDFKEKFSHVVYDLVISHAPNLRNHVRFLKDHDASIKKILMFIHGHEVMRMSNYYPKPYPFSQTNYLKDFARDMYDLLKLKILKGYFLTLFKKQKLKIVFVSEWMRDVFLTNIPIRHEILIENSYVISNTMNSIFIEQNYHLKEPKKADFITIRPLDNPKYAVDVVVELAKKHPNLSFHVYGKGEYFQHYEKPNNLEVFQQFFTPNEMADLLNHYRCALLPTRLDAQGVLMCEVATFGMPLVTSDLPICKEMLADFNNVSFFNNDRAEINLNEVLQRIHLDGLSPTLKSKFSIENTTLKEFEVIKSLVNM
jgi:glycosyltransferase involved in cell wall biosynthesis